MVFFFESVVSHARARAKSSRKRCSREGLVATIERAPYHHRWRRPSEERRRRWVRQRFGKRQPPPGASCCMRLQIRARQHRPGTNNASVCACLSTQASDGVVFSVAQQ